jgi:hypothetical protein
MGNKIQFLLTKKKSTNKNEFIFFYFEIKGKVKQVIL